MIAKQELTGRIFNIQKYSIYDGDGIRTLVFFKGCNIRCPWCANPEGLNSQFQVMFSHDKCINCGDCVSVCAFDAIHVVDGVALVDREKCTGCGACAKACPNAIISIIPEHKRKPVVLCQNKDKGAQTRKACSAGCIGCMKCAKACPKQAITVENNLAYIDQEKCVVCGDGPDVCGGLLL